MVDVFIDFDAETVDFRDELQRLKTLWLKEKYGMKELSIVVKRLTVNPQAKNSSE